MAVVRALFTKGLARVTPKKKPHEKASGKADDATEEGVRHSHCTSPDRQ